MAKSRSFRSNDTPGSDIAKGVGVGLVGGSVNTCPSDDQSLFCKASRAFAVFGWIMTVLVFLFVGWVFLAPFFSNAVRSVKKGVSGRK